MKRVLYVLALSLILLGCNKTEIMDYNGTEGIYFYVQRMPPSGYGDTTNWCANSKTKIEFTKIPVTDTILNIRVKVTGKIKEYDRPFVVVVNTDSTTAVLNLNYEPIQANLVIKAGMHYADIPVKIIRNENLQKQTLRLSLQLKENEHFRLAFNKLYSLSGSMPMSEEDEGHNPSFHYIYMNYLIVRPSGWIPKFDFAQGAAEAGFLGQFSEKKFNLVSKICGVTYEEFINPSSMPTIRVQVINQQMKAYLLNEFNAGKPVLEVDGRLMWVMGVPWTSYIGVPYVPVS